VYVVPPAIELDEPVDPDEADDPDDPDELDEPVDPVAPDEPVDPLVPPPRFAPEAPPDDVDPAVPVEPVPPPMVAFARMKLLAVEPEDEVLPAVLPVVLLPLAPAACRQPVTVTVFWPLPLCVFERPV